MPATVQIKDIVDELDAQQFEEMFSFLDLETGELAVMPCDELRRAEKEAAEEQDEEEEDAEQEGAEDTSGGAGPPVPEWIVEQRALAKRIVFSGNFVKLPDKFQIHEWNILRDFVDSLPPGRARDDLEHAIHAAGAFRHFKAAARRYKLEPEWFEFRREALREIAIDWCEQHQIPWE